MTLTVVVQGMLPPLIVTAIASSSTRKQTATRTAQRAADLGTVTV